MSNIITEARPKPKTWNLKAFATYFDSTEGEVYAVSTALTRVMRAHPLPGPTFRTKSEKTALEDFLRAHLHELPACVADAGENTARMDALGGLFRRTKSQGMVYLLRDDGEGESVQGVGRKRGGGKGGERRKKSAKGTARQGDEAKERNGEKQDKRDEAQEGDRKTNKHDEQAQDRAQGEHVASNNNSDSDSEGESSWASTETDSGTDSSSSEEEETDSEDSPTNQNTTMATTASEPAPKRIKTERNHPANALSPLHTLLLIGNIWVLNESNPRKHGLCSIQELMTTRTPQLTGLDFDRWMASVKEQCGYDASLHRLEYRAPASVGSFTRGKEICIPMLTGSQWRGALNAHVSAAGCGDPFFYMVVEGMLCPLCLADADVA